MPSTLGDWTPEAAVAIQLCKEWAVDVEVAIPCDVFLFGSAIYKGGDQFDARLSDLDLIVLFNEELPATARVERLLNLRYHKAQLELFMIPKELR